MQREAIVLFIEESQFDNFSFAFFRYQSNGSFSTIEGDGSALNILKYVLNLSVTL